MTFFARKEHDYIFFAYLGFLGQTGFPHPSGMCCLDSWDEQTDGMEHRSKKTTDPQLIDRSSVLDLRRSDICSHDTPCDSHIHIYTICRPIDPPKKYI